MSVLSDGDGNTRLCGPGQRGDRHLLSLPIDLFGQRRIDQAGRNPRQTVEEVAKTFVLVLVLVLVLDLDLDLDLDLVLDLVSSRLVSSRS